MPAGQLNWDELSADDIERILLTRSPDGPASPSPLLDCHQWIPLAGKHGWQATGAFDGAQLRCLHPTSAPPTLCVWQFSLDRLPSHAQSARGLRRLLAPQSPSGSIGDIAHGGGALYLASLPGLDMMLAAYGAEALPAWPQPTPPPQRSTAASPRLDAVTGAIFHVSREEAQTAIEYGFVFLNFQAAPKRSKQVATGDSLVFRGKGRAVIVGCELNPRSKRQWLDYELYPF